MGFTAPVRPIGDRSSTMHLYRDSWQRGFVGRKFALGKRRRTFRSSGPAGRQEQHRAAHMSGVWEGPRPAVAVRERWTEPSTDVRTARRDAVMSPEVSAAENDERLGLTSGGVRLRPRVSGRRERVLSGGDSGGRSRSLAQTVCWAICSQQAWPLLCDALHSARRARVLRRGLFPFPGLRIKGSHRCSRCP